MPGSCQDSSAAIYLGPAESGPVCWMLGIGAVGIASSAPQILGQVRDGCSYFASTALHITDEHVRHVDTSTLR